VGLLRFFDVVAFRAYYKFFLAKKDHLWRQQKMRQLANVYAALAQNLPVLYTSSPNSPQAEAFIKKLEPQIMLAGCKTLLKERIFSLASRGTFALHSGICPEYRNAHGCFWALANDELDKVGMTILKIDSGPDTGPVYAHYSASYDEVEDSHIVIQSKMVLENLEPVRQKLVDIYNGLATPIDTSGRTSAAWGQPWLTRYLKWKSRARKRRRQK
jgi:methionyl-tRNA formyltransferase